MRTSPKSLENNWAWLLKQYSSAFLGLICHWNTDRFTLLSTACQGKYVEAERLYERSQVLYEKALGPEHPDLAITLNDRAELLRAQV